MGVRSRSGAIVQRAGQAEGGRFWFMTLERLFSPAGVQLDHESRAPEGLKGPFWASIWRVPASSQARSLASLAAGLHGAQTKLNPTLAAKILSVMSEIDS